MDQRQRRIAVAIKRLILESDPNSVWSDIDTLTGGTDIIFDHPRLLRSLRFNDDDYEYCVADVVESLIHDRPENLDIMSEHFNLPQRLKEDNPVEYAKLFGHSQMLLDELRDRTISNSFELNQHIIRIQDVIESDPELAVGSTKELLESTMKTILIERGETLTNREDFPTLVKLTRKSLKLDSRDVDANAKSSDLIKRTLSNLGQLALCINELRRDYGTGHGRAGPSGVTPRHARLAVNSGAALAVFLVETLEIQQSVNS